MADRDSTRLDSLTGLRFFAALFVVLYHSSNLLDPRLLGWNLWSYGGLGVPFFFTLSGFVLTWTARSGDPAQAFWRRRFARVVPLYFFSLILGEILVQLLPIPAGHFVSLGTQAQKNPLPLASLAMVQGWIAPHSQGFLFPGPYSPNPPGWSLSDEMFFYALFPVLIGVFRPVQRRAAIGLFVLSMLFLLYFYWQAGGRLAGWLTNFPPFQIGFFVAGMATALAVKRKLWFPPLQIVLAVLLLLAAAMYYAARHLWAISTNVTMTEIIVLPFMVVLLGSAAQADLRSSWSPFRGRWLVTLGVWSFALYLVQISCFMVASCILPTGLAANRAVAVGEEICFILFVILVAAASHRLVEEPANRRLRHAPPSILSEQEHQLPASGSAPGLTTTSVR